MDFLSLFEASLKATTVEDLRVFTMSCKPCNSTNFRLSLEAHIPAGIPVASPVGSPHGIRPRGVQYASLEARCIGICGPGEPSFPVESRPASRHRGELPVPHSSLRSNRSPLASRGQAGQRRRRRLISSDDLATASFPSASGDAPLPFPFPASPCPC